MEKSSLRTNVIFFPYTVNQTLMNQSKLRCIAGLTISIARFSVSSVTFLRGQGVPGELELEIDTLIQPYHQEIELLDTIPGINQDAAASILAEIGPDMSKFPTEAHLSSWVGVCPANNESAGKKRSKKNRRGNKGLKTVL